MLLQKIPQKLKGVIPIRFSCNGKVFHVLMEEKTGRPFVDRIYTDVKKGNYAGETDIKMLMNFYDLPSEREIVQHIVNINFQKTHSQIRSKQMELEIEKISQFVQRKIKYKNSALRLDHVKMLVQKYYKYSIEWKKQIAMILNEILKDRLYERIDLKIIIRENNKERLLRLSPADYRKMHAELDAEEKEHWITQYSEESSSHVTEIA